MIACIKHERTRSSFFRRRIVNSHVCSTFQTKCHGTFPNSIITGMTYSRIPVSTPVIPFYCCTRIGISHFSSSIAIRSIIEYPYFFIVYTSGKICPQIIIYEICTEAIYCKCCRITINNTTSCLNTESHFILSLKRHLQCYFSFLTSSLRMLPANLIT